MSLDIDIQNFAGEFSAPAAGEQNTDQNFYQQESGDQAYVHQDLLEPAEATPRHKKNLRHKSLILQHSDKKSIG